MTQAGQQIRGATGSGAQTAGPPGPPGPPLTGDPNAFVYINPAGTGATDDPALTAAPIDQFGRPQILDRRYLGAGLGAVWRQGGWTADGDPVDQQGEGIVIYGAAPSGLFDAANGMFARIKNSRFALRAIIAGVDLPDAWRVDATGERFRNDLGVLVAQVLRATGDAFFGTIRTGGAAGPKWSSRPATPEGLVVGSPGDIYSNTLGGANITLWVKESGAATNTGWISK